MFKLIKRLLHINVVTVPKDKVRPLGWVNVFLTEHDRIRVSCHPYATEAHALMCCPVSKHPSSRYLRTVYIGELPCSKDS